MTRPTPSSQSRTRGLVPRFRYGYTDQHIRVSDTERIEVADRLGAHFAEGRLDQAEFDERVAQAMNAKTRGDLSGLFDDLPEPGPAGTTGTPVRGQHSPGHPVRHYVNPFFLVLLVVVITAVGTAGGGGRQGGLVARGEDLADDRSHHRDRRVRGRDADSFPCGSRQVTHVGGVLVRDDRVQLELHQPFWVDEA